LAFYRNSDYYDGSKNIFPKDKLSETNTEKSFICQAGYLVRKHYAEDVAGLESEK